MNVFDAQRMTLALMTEHGLIAQGWRFHFDRSVKRFGCCRQSRRLITLSRALVELNAESEVRDTVLHEIAHALVGPGHGHDWHWRAMARRLGARPERCYTSDRVVGVSGRFQLRCKGCGATWERFKRGRMTKRILAGNTDQWHKACGRERGQLEVVA